MEFEKLSSQISLRTRRTRRQMGQAGLPVRRQAGVPMRLATPTKTARGENARAEEFKSLG